jgi:hypothetical protein
MTPAGQYAVATSMQVVVIRSAIGSRAGFSEIAARLTDARHRCFAGGVAIATRDVTG